MSAAVTMPPPTGGGILPPDLRALLLRKVEEADAEDARRAAEKAKPAAITRATVLRAGRVAAKHYARAEDLAAQALEMRERARYHYGEADYWSRVALAGVPHISIPGAR